MIYGLYAKIAVKVLKRILPYLKKKADKTQTEIDNAVIDLVDLLIEMFETGEISAARVKLLKSRLNV